MPFTSEERRAVRFVTLAVSRFPMACPTFSPMPSPHTSISGKIVSASVPFVRGSAMFSPIWRRRTHWRRNAKKSTKTGSRSFGIGMPKCPLNSPMENVAGERRERSKLVCDSLRQSSIMLPVKSMSLPVRNSRPERQAMSATRRLIERRSRHSHQCFNIVRRRLAKSRKRTRIMQNGSEIVEISCDFFKSALRRGRVQMQPMMFQRNLPAVSGILQREN